MEDHTDPGGPGTHSLAVGAACRLRLGLCSCIPVIHEQVRRISGVAADALLDSHLLARLARLARILPLRSPVYVKDETQAGITESSGFKLTRNRRIRSGLVVVLNGIQQRRGTSAATIAATEAV